MCFRRKPKQIITDLNITSKEIVVYQPFRKNRIYMNTTVKVPRNFVFAITSNCKTMDMLYDGMNTIDVSMLPQTTKKLGLYKVDKKKRPPKFFNAEAYFVNLNLFEKFPWQTAGKVELEDKPWGLYKVSCAGELDFKIIYPQKFLDYSLSQLTVASSNSVDRLLKSYINERAARIFDKENPKSHSLYLKQEPILRTLFEKLSTWLLEIGIELEGITLTDVEFPPKILADLKGMKEQPVEAKGWGKNSFEEWQAENKPEEVQKPKFVTIVPTGKTSHFFKESIPPYFFEDDEKTTESETKVEEKVTTKPVWQGVEEIAQTQENEKASRALVNLDDNE